MEMNSKNLSIVGVLVVLVMAYYWWGKGEEAMPSENVITEKSDEVPKTTSGTKTSGAVTGITGGVPTNVAVYKDGAYVINYRSSGFSPNYLEIPAGKSVRFVNVSGKAMRISSSDTTNNPVYNAFNQSKTVGQGGIYEYTFTDKGTYSYRNINNPGDQGSIIVK